MKLLEKQKKEQTKGKEDVNLQEARKEADQTLVRRESICMFSLFFSKEFLRETILCFRGPFIAIKTIAHWVSEIFNLFFLGISQNDYFILIQVSLAWSVIKFRIVCGKILTEYKKLDNNPQVHWND